MQKEEPGRGDPNGPTDWLKLLPFEAAASSERLGWVGLEAARCRAAPPFECSPPNLNHHRLLLFTRPPEEQDLRYEGVKRNAPPPAGSISLVPVGSPAQVRSSGSTDELHIFLEPPRVEVERLSGDPLDQPRFQVDVERVKAPARAHLGGAARRYQRDGSGGRWHVSLHPLIPQLQLLRRPKEQDKPVMGEGRMGGLEFGRLTVAGSFQTYPL